MSHKHEHAHEADPSRGRYDARTVISFILLSIRSANLTEPSAKALENIEYFGYTAPG